MDDVQNPRTPTSGPGTAVVVGWCAAGLAVGVADALRAVLRLRAAPVEGLLENAPRGLDGFLLGACATSAHWLLALAPFAALAFVVARLAPRRAGLAAALPLAAGVFAFGFWVLRLRFQSGLPVASPASLAMASGVVIAAVVAALVTVRIALRLPRRAVFGTTLGVVAVGVGWMVSEARGAHATGEVSERNRELPNVLFVLVDALRADRLGAYGYGAAHTPHIDALANEGIVFEHAFVQAPYTWTSFGSFFTGKYPRRHGLVKMAPGTTLPDNVTIASHYDAARLVARDTAQLAANGTALAPEDVATGAFLTGALSHGSGLARGFDDICELMRGNALVRTHDRWSQFRAWTAFGAVATKLRTRFTPDLHLDTARRWLADHADRRFFAFVHLYSTHTPYDPPDEFRKLYVDPEYEGPITLFDAEHRRAIERGEYTPNVEDRRQIDALYMGGVSKADHDIGVLVDLLRERGVLDRTLVIVTSDHGEDLGEGGRWEHNHMYRSNLHVPLVMRLPEGASSGAPRGVRVTQHVESIDVFPTVLDVLGLEAPAVRSEQDLLDGASLLPLVRGERTDWRPYTFAEDSSLISISDEDEMLVLDRYAVKDDGWRVALEEDLGTVRYHDFASDPLQRRDLFQLLVRTPDADPEQRAKVLTRVEELRAALLAWNATLPIDVEAVVRSDRDVETETNQAQLARDRELLEKLGYAEGWDSYRGEQLRERVLELRAASQADGK
jgi:arylsulfatase A-like enzyme